MDLLHETISIFFCLLGIRSQVEVKIAHLALISPISVENNYDVCQGRDALRDQELSN